MDDDEMLVRSWNSTGYKGVYAQRTGGFRVEYGGRYVGYARSAREGAVKYAEAVAKAEAAKAEAMAKAARKAEAEAERAWDRVAEAEAILAKAKAKALDAEAETLKYKPAAEARKAHGEIKGKLADLALQLKGLALLEEMERDGGEGEGDPADAPDTL